MSQQDGKLGRYGDNESSGEQRHNDTDPNEPQNPQPGQGSLSPAPVVNGSCAIREWETTTAEQTHDHYAHGRNHEQSDRRSHDVETRRWFAALAGSADQPCRRRGCHSCPYARNNPNQAAEAPRRPPPNVPIRIASGKATPKGLGFLALYLPPPNAEVDEATSEVPQRRKDRRSRDRSPPPFNLE